MNHTKQLGAINKDTGEYEHPKIATKQNRYMCTECHNELILCKGNIRAPYFRHKVVSGNTCNHYTSPSEGEIHKDAKLLLKSLLERKNQIKCTRSCCCCKINEEFEIPEMTEGSVIKLEYRFEYNGPKIADVAYIDDDEIVCIFEICNTHKTNSENRPEPWFEIDAETLISMANDNRLTSLKIPCIRVEKCDKCIMKELKKNDIEKYVRTKLGQTIFPYDEWNEDNHLRFDFSLGGSVICELVTDQHEIIHNKKILKLFEDDFNTKKVVIINRKGAYGYACIISKSNYDKYNYWGLNYQCNWSREYALNYNTKDEFEEASGLPVEKLIFLDDKGTVELLIELIKSCELPHIESRRISQDINKEKCVL
tara:strand:+ start:580 stop:1680 length:1101 start_codon:yes stop_codon:yes gene_type:complete